MANELARAAAAAFPCEACGFLLGPARCSRVVATQVALARSSGLGSDRFDIPDLEVRRIRAYAADRDLAIVALFHSHPSGDCRLSAADRAALRYSMWPWVIITRAGETGSTVLSAYLAGTALKIEVEFVNP